MTNLKKLESQVNYFQLSSQIHMEIRQLNLIKNYNLRSLPKTINELIYLLFPFMILYKIVKYIPLLNIHYTFSEQLHENKWDKVLLRRKYLLKEKINRI